MKKLIFIPLVLYGILVFGQTPSNDPHWQLSWEDNFGFFDSNKWLKVDWAKHGSSNRQLYLSNNVYTAGGNLVITTYNNPTYCPPNPATVWGACEPCDNKVYDYTAGWTETKEAYNTQYGYLEARIKFPYGVGLWPAFWTFVGSGVSNSTNYAEIDIAEMLGDLGSGTMTTNVHYSYAPPINEGGLEISPPNYNWEDWHVYGVRWSPSKIVWYLDNQIIRTLNNHAVVDPIRIILGIGLRPDNVIPDAVLSGMPFPYAMLVDYVRVYELKQDCNTVLNACNYDFSNHDNQVKKWINISNGGGCSNTLSLGDDVFLRATDAIYINGDFTVPVGADLTLYVDQDCN
jgi:beta-glucanase (GH16 family)